MENIIKRRPYREMCDFCDVYNFMLKRFALDCANGCYPPFFEYALATPWSDKSQNHRFAIWEDQDGMAAFCWYESGLGEAFFNVADSHSFLIPEMVDHAERRLRDSQGNLRLKVFERQEKVLAEALRRGYRVVDREEQAILDFSTARLNDSLPEGYAFEIASQCDVEQLVDMTWRGFDNSGAPYGGVEREYHTYAAPHATPELGVIVKTQAGEYVCYAGMWWVPEIKLAYLEPLCTVPEHRGKGLARAALTEMYRKMARLGATHMTGGAIQFYYEIGYQPGYAVLHLEKERANRPVL